MPQLLHLDASARSRSFSHALSGAFADAWRAELPGSGYTYRDLAADPPPPIGEAWTELCDNVMAAGITEVDRLTEAVQTPEQAEAWAVLEPLLDELVLADVVLIGTPMYNYSIPASLKAWIDQVTFPRMSLAGRSFVVASARGGSYLPGSPKAPFDHQESYLRDFFHGHFAVEDVTFVHAELSNAVVDPLLAARLPEHKESYGEAIRTAEALGRDFAKGRAV